MRSIPVQRVQINGVTSVDVLEYITRENLFKQDPGKKSTSISPFKISQINQTQTLTLKMDFESFKKNFFPSYFQV